MRWQIVNIRRVRSAVMALPLVLLLLAVVPFVSGDVSHLQSSGLSITPSSQLAYYHYPAPKGAALNEYPQATLQYQQYAQQQQQQQHVSSMYTTASSQSRYAASASSATSTAAHYQQQQQQQSSQFQPIANPYAAYQQRSAQVQHQQHHQQQQHAPSQQSPIVRQFTSPALENAAFTTVLRSQGYAPAAAAAPSTAASLSSAALSPSPAASAPASASSAASLAAASDSSGAQYELRSLNVKLPVPIGITPINIAPLPLQAGTPYSSLRGVTSYGTLYPQRK